MKSDVYSWRVEPAKKADLEAELRRDGITIAKLLDDLTTDWLRERRNGHSDDDAQQAAIRRRAMAAIGSVSGADPMASERSGEMISEAIYRKYLKETHASRRLRGRRAH
jgi:hypothetical protein